MHRCGGGLLVEEQSSRELQQDLRLGVPAHRAEHGCEIVATRRERDFRVPEEFDVEEYRGRAEWQFGETVGEARIALAPDTDPVRVEAAQARWWVVRVDIPYGSGAPGSHKIWFDVDDTHSGQKVTEASVFLIPR